MTHVMLDLETWGTEPGCDIRSIGAVVFDLRGGPTEKTFYRATENPQGYWGVGTVRGRFFRRADHYKRKWRLDRDERTVQWWSEQSDEAQAAFTNPVDVDTALWQFNEWFESLGEGVCVWAHGPQFDVSILGAVYKVCKVPVPWHYRAPRDTRTLFDAAGITDHSAWLAQFPDLMGVQHHALDDAICQARAVSAAWGRLGL